MSSHGNNLTSRFENRDDIKEDVGFSPHSQELISQLYHSFDESQSYRDDLLTVLHSVIDDMHKYKTDSERLEQAHKNEKEKNEEIMTNMIEEAERQLVISNERIKDNITNEYEKVIQKLNEQHDTEIASLQEAINRSQLLEKKLRESKKEESIRFSQLKEQINQIEEEKRDLISIQRELTTQCSILRSEVALLNTKSNEKDLERQKMSVYSFESTDLKHEINILHDTNKKLADTNELLLGEMAAIKAKTKLKKNSNQASTPKSLQNCTKFFPNKPNYLTSEKPVTDDDLSDEEIDSGNWTVNSDLDVEQNKNSFSKEIDICNQKKNLNSIVEKSRSKEPQKILPDRTFKICFVGDSSVGKTSFIIRYCRNEFSQSTSATLGVDFHMKNVVHEDTNIALQLWDTCGQERFRSIAVSYFRKADAAVLMYDCTNEQSFLNVREWIQSINYMVDNPVPIILIANKIDLRNEYKAVGKRVISHDEGFILAKDYGTLFFETSTKIGTNIGESLVDLCSLMVANQEKEIIESSNIDNIKLGVETQSFKKKCC